MELPEIIAAYQGKLAKSPEDATQFILGQMQGERAHILNRRFLGLFMCGEDADGYDPIKKQLYQVDPDTESLDFEPEDGQFVLFQRMGKHAGQETAYLKGEGMLHYVQMVQVVGTKEVLQAHIYDPEQPIGRELIQAVYAQTVRTADILTARAKPTS